jgi:hypothetical protein
LAKNEPDKGRRAGFGEGTAGVGFGEEIATFDDSVVAFPSPSDGSCSAKETRRGRTPLPFGLGADCGELVEDGEVEWDGECSCGCDPLMRLLRRECDSSEGEWDPWPVKDRAEPATVIPPEMLPAREPVLLLTGLGTLLNCCANTLELDSRRSCDLSTDAPEPAAPFCVAACTGGGVGLAPLDLPRLFPAVNELRRLPLALTDASSDAEGIRGRTEPASATPLYLVTV